MRLTEQDIVNAVCLNMAERKGLKPTEVDVELMWDEDLGFSAEVFAGGRSQILTEGNLFEAIGQYLFNHHQMRVFRDQIQFILEEEIIAEIAV
ncbi:YxcD family protein [Paenibacillus sp. HWE-109]|uniref:YxcD family protein n=1 Tax=Paenibacillus sp. HWE-109 TaxID=1306526 RepID=UPI001EE05D05|nr:YxcD family protein [Paenibacillus sp. HWE-109]UKS26662.1 YxcD family protein [Paenibacillus sp. HWE-109]